MTLQAWLQFLLMQLKPVGMLTYGDTLAAQATIESSLIHLTSLLFPQKETVL